MAAKADRLTPSADGAGLTRSGTVPTWALKFTAVAAVVNVFFFGFGYAHANVKATAAPLQPPVVPANATPAPTSAPAQSAGTQSRLPTATLRPGVRTSGGAPLTATRHS